MGLGIPIMEGRYGSHLPAGKLCSTQFLTWCKKIEFWKWNPFPAIFFFDFKEKTGIL